MTLFSWFKPYENKKKQSSPEPKETLNNDMWPTAKVNQHSINITKASAKQAKAIETSSTVPTSLPVNR